MAIGPGVSIEGQKFAPGDEATPQQVLELAHAYRLAAGVLLPTGRRRKPLSRAPYRLTAIQAIELYLNAFLMVRGLTAATLRGMGHDLALRSGLAADAGLKLRKKTVEHLKALSEAREYLIMRYGPELTGNGSPLNRLDSTLAEVASKASQIVDSKRGKDPSPGR